ncbi:uncharacterized protein LOC131954152 [Physella acuta]|uniref:uncharacterized protein LOC131954152 n=1 Tax=Physella acuta TaxID=109671 RepID=UPI0027DC415F|nr:uncharacterized protein LOC131954152 [Physella acuta]
MAARKLFFDDSDFDANKLTELQAHESTDSEYLDDSDADPSYICRILKKGQWPIVESIHYPSAPVITDSSLNIVQQNNLNQNEAMDYTDMDVATQNLGLNVTQQNDTIQNEELFECTDNDITNQNRRKGRKRTKDPQAWKCYINKRKRQAGEEYHNRNKTVRRRRELKNTKDCTACKFKCSTFFSEDQRALIFAHFWSLPDERKSHFYSENTTRILKKTKRTTVEDSRRQYSFSYFFYKDGSAIRVCKPFFLNTLDISQRRISYFYDHFQTATNTPAARKQGKHVKKRIPDNVREGIREHIRSVPCVDSHYCRAKTNRKYFESELSASRLYELYTTFCQEKGYEAGKKHLYTNIFATEFNISFHHRKKDRCEKCEIFKTKTSEGTFSDEEQSRHFKHIELKEDAREERKRDRESRVPVLSFDLQKVITLPKAEVSNFYYLRKLSSYNMTAHLSVDKSTYCCVWTEGQSGRSGNDMASAIIKILESVLEKHPQIKNLILWSDSCVPQNRNRIMTEKKKDLKKMMPYMPEIDRKFMATLCAVDYRCEKNWVQDQHLCYYFSKNYEPYANWEEANSTCGRYGAFLFEGFQEETLEFVKDFVSSDVWVYLYTNHPLMCATLAPQSRQSPWGYNYISSNYHGYHDTKPTLEIHMDTNCQRKLPFICKKYVQLHEKNALFNGSLAESITNLTQQCDVMSLFYLGQCLVAVNVPLANPDAETVCASKGGTLMPDKRDVMLLNYELELKNITGDVWIKHDGEIMSSFDYMMMKMFKSRRMQLCTSLFNGTKNNHEECWKKLPFVCLLPIEKSNVTIVTEQYQQPDHPHHKCPEHEIKHRDSCYMVQSDHVYSWHDAIKHCKKLGMGLLNVKSYEEFKFVKKHVGNMSEIWIGLYMSPSGQLKSLDHQDWNLTMNLTAMNDTNTNQCIAFNNVLGKLEVKDCKEKMYTVCHGM